MGRRSQLFRFLPVLPLAAAAVLAGLPLLRPTNLLELKLMDLRFVLAGSLNESGRMAEHIVVVLMDSASESSFDTISSSRWRRFHPGLVHVLNQAGAKVIGFDTEFAAEEPQLDQAFAQACAEAGNVYAAESEEGATLPILADAFAGIGSMGVQTFRDGLPRRIGIRRQGRLPFSLVIAQAYRRRGEQRAAPAPTLAEASSVEKEGGRSGFWINFFAPPGIFPTFSYREVYAADGGRMADELRSPLSVFKDKAVLIGTDLATADRFALPNTLGRRLPGVFGHAYAAETLLSGRTIRRMQPWQNALILVVPLICLSVGMRCRYRWLRLALSVGLLVGFLAAAALLFALAHLWMNVAAFLVGFWVLLTLRWIYGRVSLAASLRRALGFDPALVESFRRESRLAGGQVRREVCVLISDVQGYTYLVSRAEPAEVVQVMTEFLAGMERAIVAAGGYINKYVGDEIIAVFGFPLSAGQRELRAVNAALTMLAELESLKRSWSSRRLPAFAGIGVGIDAGPALFAEVGGKTKSQLDIIGNCINGASRIEALTRELARPLLLSGEVWQALREGHAEELVGRFESMGSVSIRGQGEREIFALRPASG